MLRIDPRDGVPIWKQIEDGVRRLVGAGALRPGGALPSVRDLARELRVNPMTVSKAYQRLAEQGVVEVRRGEGTFVAGDPPLISRPEKARTLRDAALRYVATALTLGVSKDDASSEVATAWESGARGRGGDR